MISENVRHRCEDGSLTTTLALIRDMGVDHARGHGIGRPAPLADTVYSAG